MRMDTFRGKQKAQGSWLAFGVPILCLVTALAVVGIETLAVSLDGIKVTLQSHRYYKKWDLTRLVYRVKSPAEPSEQFFVLGVGACITDETIDRQASTSFEWVTDPFRGLRFACTRKDQRIYLWLNGQWDVGETGIAILIGEIEGGGGDDDDDNDDDDNDDDDDDDDDDDNDDHDGDHAELLLGTLDGPQCEGAALSIAVIGDASIVFPSLQGAGYFSVQGDTTLRITSSSANWSVSHALDLDVPSSASEATVARILEVLYDAYEPTEGATDVGVSYALNVEEADFAGLPEGEYVINITFTVAEN